MFRICRAVEGVQQSSFGMLQQLANGLFAAVLARALIMPIGTVVASVMATRNVFRCMFFSRFWIASGRAQAVMQSSTMENFSGNRLPTAVAG